MVFYKVNGKITFETDKDKTAKNQFMLRRELFDGGGRVERNQLPFIQTAVENIFNQTSSYRMRLDIVDLRIDRFSLAVATKYDSLKLYPLEKAAKNLLLEIGLIGTSIEISEITEANYNIRLKMSDRNDFCSNLSSFKDEFGIDNYSRDFRFVERKLEPIEYCTAKSKAPSFKEVKSYAESLCCQNLVEEITRLNKNKKYGTPVHYTIQMENMDDCKAVYNFLLDRLKKDGRILREIVNIWSNTYQDCFEWFDKRDLQKLYDKSEYGAVVIKIDYEEFSGDSLPQYYKQIKDICEVIKNNKKNVLTIICFEKNAIKQQKAFFDNLEKMIFIDFKETVIFKKDAKKFLSFLDKNDEFGIIDKFYENLEDEKGYSRIELQKSYSEFYLNFKTATEFPEYKDFNAIEEKRIDETEGLAYSSLQNMIGLTKVKNQIDNIISFAKVQKLALDKGLKSASVTNHMVFTGNPGTAKTTVARLFAQIMKDNELLRTAKFIEAGRADLVAEYLGQTAPKVKDKFRQAMGGVLFIDEAYSLWDDRKGLYGDEAINTIVQEMENHRDNIIVIFAGYKEEMQAFINRNSGLKSRVAHYIDFPDYDEKELLDIVELMAKEQDLKLIGDRDRLIDIIKTALKTSNFGNGRFARNILDKARLNQARRLTKISNPQADDILTLLIDDFELPDEYNNNNKIKAIGF